MALSFFWLFFNSIPNFNLFFWYVGVYWTTPSDIDDGALACSGINLAQESQNTCSDHRCQP